MYIDGGILGAVGYRQIRKAEFGAVTCAEGFWRHPNSSYPAPYDRPHTFQVIRDGGLDDQEVRPWGRLTAEDGDQIVAHVGLLQDLHVERYEESGVPVVRSAFWPDPAGQSFFQTAGHQGVAYFKICGPTIIAHDGLPLIVIESWEPMTPPSLRPPDPITIAGTLTRYQEPGRAGTWPMVAGYVVSSSQRFPTDAGYDFTHKWNTGQITTGAELTIHGYPLTDASPPKMVPISFTVNKQGTGAPDPGDIEFPDAPEPGAPPPPPPEYDPDPFDDIPKPEIDPDAWDFDDPEVTDHLPGGDQWVDADPPTYPGGGGTGAGGAGGGTGAGGAGGGTGAGGAGAGDIPVEAGFGKGVSMAVLGLILFPFFFGKDKRK
jgi:hypothetical protein